MNEYDAVLREAIARMAELQQALSELRAEVRSLQQQQGLSGVVLGFGGGGGGAQDARAVLTANLAAGSITSPSSTTGTILIPNGTGGWTSTGGSSVNVFSEFAAAITVSGSMFCWVQQEPSDGSYHLKVADC